MIWLVGNKGMLGSEVSLALQALGVEFIGTDREVDITDAASIRAFADETARASSGTIDWVINCAAYTAVDKAEDDRDACRLINVDGPENLAALAQRMGAGFLHVSTDYVFDGYGTRPYREDDPTNPTGYYGLTKRDGEMAVLAAHPDAYILRTAWLYGKNGNNFVRTMIRLMNERDLVRVVDDQRGNPTWARDLARAIADFVRLAREDRPAPSGRFVPAGRSVPAGRPPAGVYHFAGAGETTWFGFAREIYRLAWARGLVSTDCDVQPCTSAEYPSKVRRPPYSVLDKSKITQALGRPVPEWRESLEGYLDEMRNDAT